MKRMKISELTSEKDSARRSQNIIKHCQSIKAGWWVWSCCFSELEIGIWCLIPRCQPVPGSRWSVAFLSTNFAIPPLIKDGSSSPAELLVHEFHRAWWQFLFFPCSPARAAAGVDCQLIRAVSVSLTGLINRNYSVIRILVLMFRYGWVSKFWHW